ncbi:hypothetical protein S245_023758 [Arachis hypogaea]|nr:uncharacterized protein DS421_7g212880 [Arachis hypogaea]
MFSHRTCVNHVEDPSFPLEAFCFKTIPQLVTAQKIDENDIVDLIVEVVGKSDPRNLVTSKEMETKRFVLELEDSECVPCYLFKLTCTLIFFIQEDNRCCCCLAITGTTVFTAFYSVKWLTKSYHIFNMRG